MHNKTIAFALVISIAIFIWVASLADAPVEHQIHHPDSREMKIVHPEKSNHALTSTTENNSKEIQAPISGVALRQCRNIPHTKDALNSFLNHANEGGEPAQYINDVVNRFEFCKKFADIKVNYIQRLINEAEQGSVESLNEFWKIPVTEYAEVMGLDPQSRSDFIVNRRTFLSTKYRLAEKLALLGNEDATLKLVKSYQSYDPASLKPSYVKSLAYADFGLQTTQDNEYYLKLNWFKQRLLVSATPDEIELANSITYQLLSKANNEVKKQID